MFREHHHVSRAAVPLGLLLAGILLIPSDDYADTRGTVWVALMILAAILGVVFALTPRHRMRRYLSARIN